MARLTHLRISIPASGAPPGHVPDDCFPGGAPRKDRPGSLRVTFADNIIILGMMLPSMCSPVREEPTPLVSSVVMDDVVIPEGETNEPSDIVPDVISPPPGFPPFSWPIVTMSPSNSPVLRLAMVVRRTFLSSIRALEPPFSLIAQDQDSVSVGSPDVGLLVSPLVDISTDSVLAVIRPLSQLPTTSTTSSRRTGCGSRLLFRRRELAIVARPQYLGGGWLGRARSWRSDLLS